MIRGAHGFSTDQPRRRRITFFGFGAVGVLIAKNLGPILAEVTGFELFRDVTLSFVLAATVVYLLVSKVLWNIYPISLLIGSPPDLSGEWEGHLYTDTDEYDSEDVVGTDELGYGLVKMNAKMDIDQSWDRIRVTFEGPNSTSDSTGATILTDDGGTPTVTYNFDNPGNDLHDELESHAGTTTLKYDSDSETLKGTYYTGPNRENYGRIEVERAAS
ncbi:hypothetical protein PNP85_09485 [Halobacterium salinarum]|uniref:Cap15 family cyclic dinucleotide receptor domain-containing protein n=1 Tax=Halobacterium salinarum TaxID=2242 RepID=UPI0025524E8E|nr:hypothetical protein [Halobacterium salinarum]MDL0136982.1 hypothetical protein [Halobacterium salinarum]MDL0139734.1 hypothetical protein [Halobacterium salinarum]